MIYRIPYDILTLLVISRLMKMGRLYQIDNGKLYMISSRKEEVVFDFAIGEVQLFYTKRKRSLLIARS